MIGIFNERLFCEKQSVLAMSLENSRKKCDFCYFLVEINIGYVYSKIIVR